MSDTASDPESEGSPDYSDDDLDISAATRRALLAEHERNRGSSGGNPNSSNDIDVAHDAHLTTSEAEEVESDDSLVRELTSNVPMTRKVEWSADEDDNPRELLSRSKRRRVGTRRGHKAKSTAKTKRKQRQGQGGHAEGQDAVENETSIESSDEEHLGDDLMADKLPGYLQARKTQFRTSAELSNAGLRLPPSYEDIYFSDDDRLAELEERPNFGDHIEPSRPWEDVELRDSRGLIPASIAQYLREYQIEGVKFLHHLFVFQKGGILGDDMGLGKTVQVAAFLAAAFGKTGDERDAKRMRKMRQAESNPWYPRVLIVCPGSLIENWRAELRRWGYWHVDAFHGPDKESVLQTIKAGRLEIMISTYTTYSRHKDRINLIEWDCVIADECHQLKEPRTMTTKDMTEVNALCRIGLTGTAIQNKYDELWTLLNWTNPGDLGPLAMWRRTISQPLQIGQSHNATVQQLSKARTTAKKLANNLLPRFFLRRTKALIAHQLPKKSDRVVFCPLTDLQKAAYQTFLESNLVDIIRRSSDKCDCNSQKKRGWCCYKMSEEIQERWQALVFPAITALQKISNHLALLIPKITDAKDKQERDLKYLQFTLPDRWQQLYVNRESIINLLNPDFCGKWKVLKKLLRYWHDNGDKVLVFSHSVRLLQMLQNLFHNTSYNVSYLDGSMSYEDRARAVEDFNSDDKQFVFLISTKAGGVGLNITSANKVVIMDPNWNPSWDLQAQDRAYRIGQIRNVEVFRLVSAGTVEEIVYARQIYKQQQANIGYNASLERRYFKGVQNNPHAKGEIFGLENLLTFHGDAVLRNIVNKANIAEAKAGVNLVDVEIDESENPVNPNEKEDATMSQIAAMLTGEEKKHKPEPKTDAIQAILASASVQYTHENSEVIGTSRIEAQLSRKAQAAANDAMRGEEVLFQSDEEDEDGIYQFHPPKEVMMRQFCTMAKTFGFASTTEFALTVEGWTQEQRRNCLESFYRRRQERMDEMERERRGMGGLEANSQGEIVRRVSSPSSEVEAAHLDCPAELIYERAATPPLPGHDDSTESEFEEDMEL